MMPPTPGGGEELNIVPQSPETVLNVESNLETLSFAT